MGVSLESLQRGVLDTAKVLVDGMNTWNTFQGKGTSTAVPPIASTTVSQPSVSNQSVSNPQSMLSGLGTMPSWLWAVGIGLLLWRFK